MNLPRFPQPLDVNEVVGAPLGAEVVELPLLEDVEEGEVITLWHEELLPRRVGLLLPILDNKPKTT